MEGQSSEYGPGYRSDGKWWQKARGLYGRVIARLQRWNELGIQRRRLRELNDEQLKDIGLSKADVARIAGNRWFWDDPVNRREDLDQRHRCSDRKR